jgi:hypothetical protein
MEPARLIDQMRKPMRRRVGRKESRVPSSVCDL